MYVVGEEPLEDFSFRVLGRYADWVGHLSVYWAAWLLLHLPDPLLYAPFTLLPDIDHAFRFTTRKLAHNLMFVVLAPLPAYRLGLIPDPRYAVLAGVIHLLFDSLTRTGVRFLWPLKSPHLKGPFRSGWSTGVLGVIILLLVKFGLKLWV